MNNDIKAKAVDVYEKREDLFNAWCPNDIINLVIDEDRAKLIPYIEDEIRIAGNMGAGAGAYIHELEHLKAMLEEETK